MITTELESRLPIDLYPGGSPYHKAQKILKSVIDQELVKKLNEYSDYDYLF